MSNHYGVTSLLGAAPGSLQNLGILAVNGPVGQSAILATGDSVQITAFGPHSTVAFYVFDSAATDPTNSPYVIRPHDFVSAGVWRLVSPTLIVSGMPCLYDQTRLKALSLSRHNILFSHDGLAADQYLFCGGVSSILSSPRLIKNITITDISVNLSENGSGTFRVTSAFGSIDQSLTCTASNYATLTNLNLDVPALDRLICSVSNANNINSPILVVEFAQRP